MDWSRVLFSFKGRLSRQPYWVTLVLFVTVGIILMGVGLVVTRLPPEAMFGPHPTAATIRLLSSLILLYPSLAVSVKRLHDRGRTGWWAGLLFVLTIAIDIADLAGLSSTEGKPSALFMALGPLVLIAGLWLFIELGFLKGTPGPNPYGPDPLGAEAPEAEAPTDDLPEPETPEEPVPAAPTEPPAS